MTPKSMRYAIVISGALLWAGGCQAADADPDAHAIQALLAAGNLPAGQFPGCSGSLPGVAHPTIGDLVGSRLSYLAGGTNLVKGSCGRNGRCVVSIRHADGEDVESAEFRFRMAAGRLDRKSLACLFTP